MTVKVVNMIPNSMSNESGRDSEPNVTASFLDPSRIAASVFTPDPMNSGSAPIYVSTDGGDTWGLTPGILPGGNKTGDTTLRFVGPSNVLYAGILRSDNGELNILRKADFTAPGLMQLLVDKTNDDQPYVEGATVFAGPGVGSDVVYVGENDFGAPSGHTATIDFSLNAATAPPPAGFVTNNHIETRATAGQDGPPIRPAVHLDGTVYGVYQGWRSSTTMDVVVVRDNNWASAANPFTALIDPGDGNAGLRVVTGASRAPFADLLGTQRVGGQLAIAVDPRNSSVLYIAWADGSAGANQTIHVRRSTDRGVNWSGDLRTISTATNPGLAVDRQGTVGFLYQKLHNPGPSNRWQTHFETSTDGFTTVNDLILADVPDNNGAYPGPNPIGDYAGVIAVGKNFYGIFCGNNTPDLANFPNAVTYQRNANFTTHTLFDLGNNPIPASIDPFFFKLITVEAFDDFYVRDWTESPASGDTGVEPSTNPVFYATSDVWNRRGTLPGPFPNDQPDNEDAGNGTGNIGDNWAYARIRRNAPASGSQMVSAHFLVSKFGTGSNYVDSTAGDPDLSFPDPDPTATFNAADTGPITTPAYHWHLNAVASTHLCLAVEITGQNDPFVAPSLVGNAPGWPTTDLRIIDDNNKAQRNMGLSTTPARGVGMNDCFYAIVHNAATFSRDLELGYECSREVADIFKSAHVDVIGGESQPLGQRGSMLFAKMLPAENRWVGLHFPAASGQDGQIFAVNFFEVVGGIAINGFGMGARLASMDKVIQHKLLLHRSVFTRIAAGFGLDQAKEAADAAAKLLEENKHSGLEYLHFVRQQLPILERTLTELVSANQGQDPFRIVPAIREFAGVVEAGQADAAAVLHGCILNRVDSLLTMRQLEKGNVADILQNVRWQKDLYTIKARLAKLNHAPELRKRSEEFILSYGARKLGNKDYAELMRGLFNYFKETSDALPAAGLHEAVRQMEQNLNDLTRLQKAHRDVLLRLQETA
jgi:hypothetical protein